MLLQRCPPGVFFRFWRGSLRFDGLAIGRHRLYGVVSVLTGCVVRFLGRLKARRGGSDVVLRGAEVVPLGLDLVKDGSFVCLTSGIALLSERVRVANLFVASDFALLGLLTSLLGALGTLALLRGGGITCFSCKGVPDLACHSYFNGLVLLW